MTPLSRPAPPRRLREPPPRHARADPVGGLKGIERAALAQLAAAEADVDVAARLTAAVRVADQGHELAQRLRHADLHSAAEGALERSRVLGHLTCDRREDLGRDRAQLRLDHVGHFGWE